MPKVTAPLFSLVASGTFAKTITFVCGRFARVAKQKGSDSSYVPTAQNAKFTQAVAIWNSLSPETKNLWKLYGDFFDTVSVCVDFKFWITGYTLFMCYCLSFGPNGWENYPDPGPKP